MSILTKIITAIRGGAREVGEHIVDKNSIRIFEQEIKDAQNTLEKAKRDLTTVIAHEMQTSRVIELLNTDIEKHEHYASDALEKGNEELALKIAEKIVEFQDELESQKKIQEGLSEKSGRLKNMIKQASTTLSEYERQLAMVKTTESVHKATKAITDNYASNNSTLLSAKESLDRIRQKQQDIDNKMAASEILEHELEESSLTNKLKEAGIIQENDKAKNVLAHIKEKKS